GSTSYSPSVTSSPSPPVIACCETTAAHAAVVHSPNLAADTRRKGSTSNVSFLILETQILRPTELLESFFLEKLSSCLKKWYSRDERIEPTAHCRLKVAVFGISPIMLRILRRCSFAGIQEKVLYQEDHEAP
ncbi:unnamed protein product, partial [Brugia pahangi]|uniref:HORMA domain-containing protein n=1 Tax=Brugia pahangi TaxID=6280 RepID=A0A0N4TFB1_BRUPA